MTTAALATTQVRQLAPATPALRLALIAPPTTSVPPASLGGLDQVRWLAEGLAERGHHITLIGAGLGGLITGPYVAIDTDPTGGQRTSVERPTATSWSRSASAARSRSWRPSRRLPRPRRSWSPARGRPPVPRALHRREPEPGRFRARLPGRGPAARQARRVLICVADQCSVSRVEASAAVYQSSPA